MYIHIYVVYMVKAMIDISEESNRVLNIVKAKYGFVDKSHAIDFVVKEFEENRLEPSLRPEFVAKLKKVDRGKFHRYSSVDELRRELENV